jgi:hypothetical protein
LMMSGLFFPDHAGRTPPPGWVLRAVFEGVQP